MRRLLGFFMVGLLFAGTAAACSSDDDGGGDTTTTAADSGGGSTDTTAADSGDSGGGSAEVEQYCSDTAALAEDLQAVIDDPTSGNIADLTAQQTELVSSAAGLISANPDDVDRINECSEVLSSVHP